MIAYAIAWPLIIFMSYILIRWHARILEKLGLAVVGDIFYVPREKCKIREFQKK